MSADLLDQLRTLAQQYDEVATPVTADEVQAHSESGAMSRATPVAPLAMRILAVAASLALLAGAVSIPPVTGGGARSDDGGS